MTVPKFIERYHTRRNLAERVEEGLVQEVLATPVSDEEVASIQNDLQAYIDSRFSGGTGG